MQQFLQLFHHQYHSKAEILRFLFLRSVGNFLFLIALAGIVSIFAQAAFVEIVYRVDVARGVKYVVTDVAVTGSKSYFTQPDDNTVMISPVNTTFSVVIPKINANAPVVPNVDPSNYEQYIQALKEGIAHAAGSVFPGMNGNVYLFAHSTDFAWNVGRFNAVFYLLKELHKSDEVDVFYQGRRYVYLVTDTKIVTPDDTSYLKGNLQGEARLTLQTCWPPGTTLRRLLVFAKPKAP